MGMDIYGTHPKAPVGAYFWSSIFDWHPLAELIEDLCPTIAERCPCWHRNEGAGLDDADSRALARALERAI